MARTASATTATETDAKSPIKALLDEVKASKAELATAQAELVTARERFSTAQLGLQAKLVAARDNSEQLAPTANKYITDPRLFSNSSETTFESGTDDLIKDLAVLFVG